MPGVASTKLQYVALFNMYMFLAMALTITTHNDDMSLEHIFNSSKTAFTV